MTLEEIIERNLDPKQVTPLSELVPHQAALYSHFKATLASEPVVVVLDDKGEFKGRIVGEDDFDKAVKEYHGPSFNDECLDLALTFSVMLDSLK